MEQERGPVIAGIDTHKKKHALCLLDGWGRKMFESFFSADEKGYAEIAEAIGSPEDCIVVGIEGTMSYGAGVCRYLVEKGYPVVEVLGPESARKKKGANKDDLKDAERAARTAIAGDHVSVPKSGSGWVEGVRALLAARRLAVKTSTAATNAVKALLVTAPERIKAKHAGMDTESMMKSLSRKHTKEDPIENALYDSLRSLARMWHEAREQVDALESEIEDLMNENAPALMAMDGCGAITGAQLAVTAGDNPERMKSKDSFAALCGVSPVEASSGETVRHRLNRGGDRLANCALTQIVLSRMQHDERTKAYVAKRRAQGRSKKEIKRCLKRYVANEAYRILLNPKDVPDWQGSELAKTRKALGLTQRDAASLLLVSQAKISEIERGGRRYLKLEKQYSEALQQLQTKRILDEGRDAA